MALATTLAKMKHECKASATTPEISKLEWWPHHYPDIGYAEICAWCEESAARVGPEPGDPSQTDGLHELEVDYMWMRSAFDHEQWEQRKSVAHAWQVRKCVWLTSVAVAFLSVSRRRALPVLLPGDMVRLLVDTIRRQ
jgi:hypothetical protein